MSNEFSARARTWDDNPVRVRISEVFSERVTDLVDLTGADVLEFGCGSGVLGLSHAGKVHHLTMLDTSEAMLEIVQEKTEYFSHENVTLLHSEIENASLQPASFDLIYTLMVLHHVEDVSGVLASFHRYLREGGHLIIGDLCTEDGSFHKDIPAPHKGFDPVELGASLEQIGFEVVHSEIFNTIERPDEEGVVRKYDQFLLSVQKK